MSWLASIAGVLLGNWQRLAIYGLLATIALGAAAGWGYMRGVERLYAYQADQARQAVRILVKQGEATERVVVKYVKVAGATRTVTQTVEKEVIRYVDQNPGSCLDHRWGVLHDAAASNTLPPGPGPADGASGAPTAAETLETVTGSYAACHRTADRLEALQAWVKAQAEVRP